jgi:hypothetical protein
VSTVDASCTNCGDPHAHHVLLDGDGGHARCGGCLIQLLADVERLGATHLVFSVESTPSPVDVP